MHGRCRNGAEIGNLACTSRRSHEQETNVFQNATVPIADNKSFTTTTTTNKHNKQTQQTQQTNMQFRRMGSAASSSGVVVVVHSANVQEDREALMAIFPDKFQVERQPPPQPQQTFSAGVASSESLLLQWSDQDGGGMLLVVVLLSCTYAKGTYSSVVLGDDEDIRQATDRATLYGVKVVGGSGYNSSSNNSLSEPLMAKLILPGGATVWLTTSESWKSEEARNSTLTRCLATPSEDVGVRLSLSPKGRKIRSINVPTTTATTTSTTTSTASEQETARVVEAGRPTTVCVVANPLFPSLRVQVLSHNNEMQPYQLNTEQGVPIETDWFVGALLLVMRPVNPEQDPYWNEQIFSKKKRRVLMQLQGKLKYTPEGELYAGMEIADPMRLGLLASGLCSLLLKMSSKFNPQLHYSFGDDNERAHISFPASTFFEEMVITPPGETPPPLGKAFEEDPVVAQQRKAYKTKINWNTNDTYSMSFHSMYLDFPSWSVVRLPIGKDVGLQTFWGNSPASVVWYEVDSTCKKKHVTSAIKYLAAVEMKNIGKDADDSINESIRPGDESDHDSEDQFVEVDFDSGSISTNGDGSLLPPLNNDGDVEDQEFFDTMQSQSLLPPSLDTGLANISAASSHAAVMHLIDKCCPCVIDMPGQKGKYSHVFAFYNRQAESRPLYRSLDIAHELMGDRFLSEIDDGIFTTRLSPIETNRRSIGLRYAEALIGKASPSKMSQFQRLNTFHDKNFLQRAGIRKNDSSILSCMVARAVSDRHWIEEWACITNDEVLFYRLDHSNPYFRISLASIVKVEPLPKEEWPIIQGYHFLSIETFGRATCLMFKSAKQTQDWIETILDHRSKPQEIVQSCNSFSSHLIDVDEPSSEFLRRSSMWDCSKRKLLNCRKFSFRTPSKTDPESTLSIAETALRKAAALDPKGSADSALIAFLDCASALKEADARALNEEQRFAFFLNVYHIMIMHAYVVLGPPDSSLKWLTYFNTTSYQCADDIFSISELEHNIVRAQMSFPSQFLSRFVVPKSNYQFALTKKDIRISFALNCGSLSIPMSTVPVYMAETLDEQLDGTTRSFLAEAVSIRPKGSRDASVVLPRVCQWFADDFGDGSAADIVKAIEPYLTPEQRSYLQRLWNERKQTYDLGLFNPKYSNYNFECRFLKLDQAKV